jgi:hypothetical protein
MLFTDGLVLSSEKLREHDNYILEVASTESIELSSKLAVAQRSVGYELTSFLLSWDTPIELSRVVVNDELRDVLALQTLAAVYRDAYNRHLNDRYHGRWKEFSVMGDRAMLRYLQNGVGVVSHPAPLAEKPTVDTAVTGGLDPAVYTVQIAWQHMSGTVGERSEAVLADCAEGGMTVVPPVEPLGMAGWHVFIGVGESPVLRQNESPITPGIPWTQAAGLRDDLLGPDASGPSMYVRSTSQRVRR